MVRTINNVWSGHLCGACCVELSCAELFRVVCVHTTHLVHSEKDLKVCVHSHIHIRARSNLDPSFDPSFDHFLRETALAVARNTSHTTQMSRPHIIYVVRTISFHFICPMLVILQTDV